MTAVLSYADALAAIQSRGRFGIRLGLSRTCALLAALGHPEREVRGALVAGTNGKGSVLALTGSALAAAGYRVGMTPKPHLVTYRERLQIAEPMEAVGAATAGAIEARLGATADAKPAGTAALPGPHLVDPETFARLTGEVLRVADRVAARHGEPTEFELLTALTFRWFAEAGVDLAVVEVGLGGRLDATHAWDGGVAVVTNVALDHMAQLGSTVEAIAKEKAAIIMRGDIAVTGADGTALPVVERRARRVGAPLTVVKAPPLVSTLRDGTAVELPGLGPTTIGLFGRHQAANAAVANATLDALATAGVAAVDAAARRRGFATARWPGRVEVVEYGGHEVVLDGAHNPAGALALAAALDDLAPVLRPGRPTLVFGIMADKDVRGVIEALGRSAALHRAAIVCTAPQGGRAMPARELAAAWAEMAGAPAEPVDSPADAIDRALERADGPVIVAGSLYLVGFARARLVDDPRLVPDPPLP